MVAANEPLGFVVVPNGVFHSSSECVKGDCWENVVRKQRWFPDCRRSRAVRWENCPEGRFFPTSRYYSGFGIKLSPIFGFAKSSQIQNQFPIKPIAQIRCNSCYRQAIYVRLIKFTSIILCIISIQIS